MKGLKQFQNRNSSRNGLRAHRSATVNYLKNRAAGVYRDEDYIERHATALVSLGSIKQTDFGYRTEGFRHGNHTSGSHFIVRTKTGFTCDCICFRDISKCGHTRAAEKLDEEAQKAKEDFHYQAGEGELHYENDDYAQTA